MTTIVTGRQRYRFTTDYRSGLGAWAAGDVAEFDDETAAWLARDAAGCIEPVPDGEQEVRALTAPAHDRQMKRAPRTR